MQADNKPESQEKKLKTVHALVCSVCGKYFFHQSSLTRHELTHTDKKPYRCNVCGKSYTNAGNLKTHKVIHSSVKPFRCTECGKEFTQRSNLKSHMTTHTGEKPIVCPICQRCFNHMSELERHELTHSGLKLHTCDVCFKSYSTAGNLKTHKMTHTGERPFLCKICGRSFRQRSNLNTHVATHTSGKRNSKRNDHKDQNVINSDNDSTISVDIPTNTATYTCEVCLKSFSSKNNLKRHQESHVDDCDKYIFKCVDCGRMYNSNVEILSTQDVDKKQEVVDFRCAECNDLSADDISEMSVSTIGS